MTSLRITYTVMDMAQELKPTEILSDAIKHLRRTHMNTYSWSMSVSDEEAVDILSETIVKVAQ